MVWADTVEDGPGARRRDRTPEPLPEFVGLVRDGSCYNTAEAHRRCAALRPLIRGGSGNGVGFRCCE